MYHVNPMAICDGYDPWAEVGTRKNVYFSVKDPSGRSFLIGVGTEALLSQSKCTSNEFCFSLVLAQR